MNPSTPEAARALLADLGAPARLLRHAELVGEAAEALLTGFARLGVSLRADYVRVGVVLHDAGKAVHREELDAPGSAHEPEGERLLLERGGRAGVPLARGLARPRTDLGGAGDRPRRQALEGGARDGA